MIVQNKKYILVFALLMVIKILITNLVGFAKEDLQLDYRVNSLITFGVDERGMNWPMTFRNSSGLEMPLPTYFYIPIKFAFKENALLIADVLVLLIVSIVLMKIATSWQLTFSVLVSPILLWPGLWSEKIALVCLVGYWLLNKKQLQLKVLLFLIGLLSNPLFVWFIVLGELARLVTTRQGWRWFLIVLGISVMYTFVINGTNYYRNELTKSFREIEFINNTNKFRGYADKAINGSGRVFFNKSGQLAYYVSKSMYYLNPSFWFGKGDMNIASNSYLIPLFSIASLLALGNYLKNKSNFNLWLILFSSAIVPLIANSPDSERFSWGMGSVLIAMIISRSKTYKLELFMVILSLAITLIGIFTIPRQITQKINLQDKPKMVLLSGDYFDIYSNEN